MRTTVNLDDDVYEAARALADAHQESLGRALSRLARKGLQPVRPAVRRKRGGFPVVSLPPDSPVVSDESVRRALEDEPSR